MWPRASVIHFSVQPEPVYPIPVFFTSAKMECVDLIVTHLSCLVTRMQENHTMKEDSLPEYCAVLNLVSSRALSKTPNVTTYKTSILLPITGVKLEL
jgi:hypothetical protein